jgi:hypothetical protein
MGEPRYREYPIRATLASFIFGRWKAMALFTMRCRKEFCRTAVSSWSFISTIPFERISQTVKARFSLRVSWSAR